MSDNEQADAVEEAAEAEESDVDEHVDSEPADASESDGGAGSVEGTEPDEGVASDDESGIQDGDFVKLEYTVRTVEDDSVVDTTDREVAEEAEIDTEDYEFEPRTIVVGGGHVFPSVEEALIGAEVGDSGTVDVPADEAFGEYDPDQVRTVSADKIPEDDRYPGARVQVDGQQGFVETIIGGRARVDFNHPLAGEDLEYEYEVVDVVEDRIERAEGLLGMHLQQVPDMWIQTDEVEVEIPVEHSEDEDGEVTHETETELQEQEGLYIEATPQMTMNQQWLFQKQQIAQELMTRIGVDRVVIQEIIDGSGGMGMGMGGMMGGMGSMGGGMEEALEDVDVDADELVEELEEGDLDAEDLEAEDLDAAEE